MPFEEFLREFQALLRGDTRNSQEARMRAKRALAYVFGLKRAQLDSFRPTQLETRDFVDYLLSAINLEDKALSPDRRAALSRVLAYNETPGKLCFADIDPHVFAFQLALRIREPSLINQQDAGVCGEASLMMFFAKNTPSAFAEYAISLMRNGWGKLHHLTIEPSGHTISGWGPRRGMSEADVVTVGSLGLSLIAFWEGRTSGTLCRWLRDAGFGNVVDNVIDFSGLPSEAKLRDNLAGAEAAVSAKKLVIMAVQEDLVKRLQETKALAAQLLGKPHKSAAGMESIIIGPRSLESRSNPLRGTNHWVLVSFIETQKKYVTVKLYSWRDSMTGKFEISTFLTYYGGCIVAEPPAQKKSAERESAKDGSTDENLGEDEWAEDDFGEDELAESGSPKNQSAVEGPEQRQAPGPT